MPLDFAFFTSSTGFSFFTLLLVLGTMSSKGLNKTYRGEKHLITFLYCKLVIWDSTESQPIDLECTKQPVLCSIPSEVGADSSRNDFSLPCQHQPGQETQSHNSESRKIPSLPFLWGILTATRPGGSVRTVWQKWPQYPYHYLLCSLPGLETSSP